ncbi:hypothetical protein F0562_030796 [Nyssa sinensis]|uniref:Uncharacterized protein n=1 Tax=Nyssa sinensis TaxID=561372 RepID=A0A5J5AXU4_9ASTE|nr:hypothetical protein F0562_030796 [Nyssa sinensis]
MAVAEVVSLVIQKLTDMLNEESFTFHKGVDREVEQMKKDVQDMRGFLIDAEDKKQDEWARDCLGTVYSVEDLIETALGKARQRRMTMGFLTNYALFFNNWTLYRKMKETRCKMEVLLQKKRPQVVQDASQKFIKSHSQSQHNRRSFSGHDGDHHEEEERESSASASGLLRTLSHKSRFRKRLQQSNGRVMELTKQPPLSQRESWDLFLIQAGLELGESKPNIFSDCVQKIMEICKGVHQNIVLLGGLIWANNVTNHDELLDVLKQVQENCRQRQRQRQPQPHTSSEIDIDVDILWLCYNHLLDHSKLCLLYLSLFPKTCEIPVRRLLRLWLSEGFVKRSPKKIQEDAVQEYFEDLVNRNMIDISKLRSDGSERRCRLSVFLHDNLLSKAHYIYLFHVHDNTHGCKPAPSVIRRMVEHGDIDNGPLNDPSKLGDLRSYLLFNIPKKDTPARKVGNFVNKTIGKRGFGLLRVLDLEGAYKPSLPEKLGDLVHLRYLGLRWTFLDALPSSIGKLPYLETLDVKHTCINSLPKSIWKLKHLRHLNLNNNHLDMPVSPSTQQLITLWGLVVDDKRVNNVVTRFPELRELGITFNLSSRQELLVEWIAKLTDLQSLRLRSKDEMGRPSQLILKPLSNLEKLSHLNLLGNLTKQPKERDFPPNVKVVTLSVSDLKEDPMPTLAKLPNLTVLRLLKDSYRGQRMECPPQGFAKLRVLKLWMLKELEEWDVKEGGFQSLKELNIRYCLKLKNIPLRVLKLSSLEELTLTSMPDLIREHALLQNKNSHLKIEIDAFKFSPLPWEEDDTLWNK